MVKCYQPPLAALVILSASVLFGACGKMETSGADGESHFLLICATDADCGGLSCLCGVCTETCEESAACSSIDERARCLTPEAIACGEMTCQVSCEGTSDCEDDESCSDGRCVREAKGMSAPSGDGDDAAQEPTSSGGQASAGDGDGGDGDDPVEMMTEVGGAAGGASLMERLVVLSPVADAQITANLAASPGSGSWGDTNFGRRDGISIGAYDSNTVMRGLFRFELPEWTPAQVKEARFIVTPTLWTEKWFAPESFRIDLHVLLKSWKEGSAVQAANSSETDGVTGAERFWGAQDGSEDWDVPGLSLTTDASSPAATQAGALPNSLAPISFDVTAVVESWLSGEAANHGFVLRNPDDQSSTYPHIPQLYSREAEEQAVRPRLEITILE